MKKFYFLLLSATFLSVSAFSQCAPDVNVVAITHPTCGSSNGGFDVQSMGIAGTFNITIDTTGGVPITIPTTGNTSVFSGLHAGLYHIKIVNQATPGTVCDSFDFILRSDYAAAFTHTPTSATGCHNTDGSILLGGGLVATDSVSWLSAYTPTFTVVSSLSGGNTITGLVPGLYYVTVKGNSSTYCFTTDTVTVGNTGIACPAATFCGTATDTSNLFPNGTFDSGATINAGPLLTGKTSYQYQPIGSYSPEDGFYAIANNTFVGTYTSYHDGLPKVTPFDNGWAQGWDHDHWVTGGNTGYMMVVNADFDPNIVIEDTVSNLCVGKTYQFSAWIRSLVPSGGGNQPSNETFLIDGIGYYNTGNLFGTLGAPVQSDWHQVGFTFIATGTQAVVSLRNNAPGGQGNDFALDDIYVGSCAPNVHIIPLPADLCDFPQLNDSAVVVDSSSLFQYYQWQVDKQDGNGYQDVAGGAQTGVFGSAGTDAYYAITPLPIPLIGAGGWTYRVIVATAPANLAFPKCSFTSLDSSTLPGCVNYPLPVTFISVKAQLNNTVGDVNWKVGDQSNVSYYVVEKSTDQVNFTDVTTVPPIKGSSVLSYQAADYNLAEGTTYYRIKSVDIDGQVSYSPTAALSYGGGGTITVLNPVTDVLKIFTPPTTTIRQVVILDAIGRLIIEQDDINTSNPSIPVSTLTQGFYNLKVVSTDGTVTNLSFIKK